MTHRQIIWIYRDVHKRGHMSARDRKRLHWNVVHRVSICVSDLVERIEIYIDIYGFKMNVMIVDWVITWFERVSNEWIECVQMNRKESQILLAKNPCSFLLVSIEILNLLREIEEDWKREKKVPPRFELGLQDSESWVLTITPWDQQKDCLRWLFQG